MGRGSLRLRGRVVGRRVLGGVGDPLISVVLRF